jgi:hypothetical protein
VFRVRLSDGAKATEVEKERKDQVDTGGSRCRKSFGFRWDST